MPDYTETTQQITVGVTPEYLREQSLPDEEFFAWGYRVMITNGSSRPVQLLSRYWKITNAYGHVEQVHGPGVIGEQPIIQPGMTYLYASWVHLPTSGGLMQGYYTMEEIIDEMDNRGARFTVTIPTFSLDSDEELARPN